MKFFLTLAIAFFSTSVFSQFKTSPNGYLYYEKDITVSEENSEIIKTNFKNWLENKSENLEVKATKQTDSSVVIDGTAILKEINNTQLYLVLNSTFTENQLHLLINYLDVGQFSKTPVKKDFPDFKTFKANMQETVNRLKGNAKTKNQAILDDAKKMDQIYQKALQNHQKMVKAVKHYIQNCVDGIQQAVAD